MSELAGEFQLNDLALERGVSRGYLIKELIRAGLEDRVILPLPQLGDGGLQPLDLRRHRSGCVVVADRPVSGSIALAGPDRARRLAGPRWAAV